MGVSVRSLEGEVGGVAIKPQQHPEGGRKEKRKQPNK